MCKNHDKKLLSDIRSCAAAEFTFGKLPYSGNIEDDCNTQKKREEYLKNPDDEAAIISLGDALAHQARYNEALSLYSKACELYPHSYIAHRKRAVRLLSVLDLQNAKTELEECLRNTDDKSDVLYLIAMVDYCLGDYATAITSLKRCYPLFDGDDEMTVAVIYWHILCLVRQGKSVNEAIAHYSDKFECGHHTGYKKTVEAFINNDHTAGDGIEDELNRCIYAYGLHAYFLHLSNYKKAAEYLEKTLALNTYFASYAYLSAYSEKRAYETAKLSLKDFFANHKKLALAFSGGVDSALLLREAKECGADIKAYFIKTQFQPPFELNDAINTAKQCDADLEILHCKIFEDDILKNGDDRCYFCKKKIFSEIVKRANDDGYAVVIDGTNASDDLKDRPGARALCEFKILSPLRICGVDKTAVRELALEYGLTVWNKPSYSCLATRVAKGERIDEANLTRIQRAEEYLFSMGYENFRVRCSQGDACLEISGKQKEKFQSEKKEIFKELSRFFVNVRGSDIWR